MSSTIVNNMWTGYESSPLGNFKYYLFDFDGTLFDSFDLILASATVVARKFKPSIYTENAGLDLAVAAKWVGLGMRDFISNMFLQPAITDEEWEVTYRYFREYQNSIFKDHAKLFPGVMDTLRALKAQGKRLAIVTSRTRPTLEPYMKYLGLWDVFDVIVSPEDVRAHKPDPHPVFVAMERLGATADEAEDVVMVGDTKFDVGAGHAAGVASCLVGWATNSPLEMDPRPTHVAYSMDAFLKKE